MNHESNASASRQPDQVQDGVLELTISAVERGEPDHGFTPIRLVTSRGPIDCRLYEPDVRTIARHPGAVIWVPGAIGGYHSPAHGLYDRVTQQLLQHGIR
jgi:hypothetical protein